MNNCRATDIGKKCQMKGKIDCPFEMCEPMTIFDSYNKIRKEELEKLITVFLWIRSTGAASSN